jgi:hypothetical protein
VSARGAFIGYPLVLLFLHHGARNIYIHSHTLSICMGDRAQVNVIGNVGKEWNTDIWLYTHWGGRELPATVKDVIARGERWQDPEYLARMIFSSMTRGQEDSATGFGIGNSQHGDVYRVVTVDTDNLEFVSDGFKQETVRYSFNELRERFSEAEVNGPPGQGTA